jgi:hypothetical protein
MPGFVENTGYLLTPLLAMAVLIGFFSERLKSKYAGAAYLAPLFLATPQGITVVRGYMLVGTYLLLISVAVVLDKLVLVAAFRKPLIIIIIACYGVTLWGTVESIFGRDQLLDPSGIKIERGGIPPDPGSKAAGFLLRKMSKIISGAGVTPKKLPKEKLDNLVQTISEEIVNPLDAAGVS